MAPLPRILAALCGALLAAGAAGVATHSARHTGSHASRAPRSSSTTVRPTPVSLPVSVPGPPGASSSALAAGLITPTDMGGYYRIVPSSAVSMLDSAACLAPLQASPAQSGRAVTALLGPDSYSVPTIVEEVSSYPGTSARQVYNSVVTALGACSSLSFSFGGSAATSRLSPSSIPPVGDADHVWAGSFTAAGASFTIQLGLILDGQDVLAVIWIDRSPPSDPIMGSFTSTVSLAIGKLA